METWKVFFPNGRVIFYEGDDPEAFRKEIIGRFGFDPATASSPPGFDLFGWEPAYTAERGYSFHCPAEHLDSITDRYPMGSYPVHFCPDAPDSHLVPQVNLSRNLRKSRSYRRVCAAHKQALITQRTNCNEY